MLLVCPAGNLATFKAAIDNGADTIYVGFKNQTNARRFGGLNFTAKALQNALAMAHKKSVDVLVAINTYPRDPDRAVWTETIDQAAALGVDGLILADLGLLAYAAKHYPNLPRHLSVQASATSAASLRFYHERYGIRRAVLPRVLHFEQIRQICASVPIEIEVFGFGSLCVMTEGRCLLSSWLCGESPNTHGACSPSRFVEWQNNQDDCLDCRLNNHLLERYQAGEAASYPTICKGRYLLPNHPVTHQPNYAFEEPRSLNLLDYLDQLVKSGVDAIKIEGRQRSPAYVATVTRIWRQAMDAYQTASTPTLADNKAMKALQQLSEGQQTTAGPYVQGND